MQIIGGQKVHLFSKIDIESKWINGKVKFYEYNTYYMHQKPFAICKSKFWMSCLKNLNYLLVKKTSKEQMNFLANLIRLNDLLHIKNNLL